MRFAGQIVVVTGAGRGLGYGIAERFKAEGAQVIVAELDAPLGAEAAQKLGARFLPLDVRDAKAVETVVAQVVADYGRIDVWVNNAGVAHKAPVLDLELAAWEADISTLLTGAFYCAKYAGAVMVRQGRGVLVNISSVNGLLAQKSRAAYASAKAGLNMLTKVLASEWGDKGVRVNAVAPGVVMTDLVQAGIDQGEVSLETYLSRIPMGRLADVNEVAEAVLFLASDEASFMTGEVLRVDGGWTAYHLFYPFETAF
jgi:NAD(P)-dependent dehydrogenase (short-subunit alcohol dehydrogenase family)